MTTSTVSIPEVNLIRASNISQCLFDFTNIMTRQTIDGVVIINLNDIFALFDDVNIRGQFLKEIISKVSSIELAVIIYLDARELYNNWRPVMQAEPEEKILLEFAKHYNSLLRDIYTHAGLHAKQVNSLISFRYDAMHITGFDFKKFIMSCVNSTVKYIAKTIESQFWLIGQQSPIDYTHISANTNFMAMITHDFRFVSLADVISKSNMVFNKLPMMVPDITLPYMREYLVIKTVMVSNRTECIKRMTTYRDKLRDQYTQIIETADTASHQVIFLNLDPEFDSNLLLPIKDIWSSHPYIKTKQNKKTESAKTVSAVAGADQLESLINMLGIAAAASNSEDNCSSQGNSRCKNGTVTADIIITTTNPESLASLLGGSSIKPSSHVQTIKTKNTINYTELPVLKFGKSPFQPSKLSCLNNLVFPDKGLKKGSINVIIGQNITWDNFQKMTEYIIDNPKYPNNITAKYVDFKINPLIRTNLGMMKYASEYFHLNQLGKPMNHDDCHKLYTKFIQWAEWVKKSSNIATQNTQPDADTLPPPLTLGASVTHDSCTCCKCISKKGMARYEVGNLPYVDSTVLSIIQETPSFWMPRY